MSTSDLPPVNGSKRRSSPADVQIPAHGVWVLESHHAETFHMELGRWPFHKICWVAMGSGRLELAGTTHLIERNQFLLLPAELEHRFVDRRAEPLTLVIACLDERFLVRGGLGERSFLEACALHPGGQPCQARSAFQHAEMVDRFKLMLREQGMKQPGWELASLAAASELITQVRRSCLPIEAAEVGSVRAVDGVVEFLDGNFHKQLQLPELADRCGLSPRRFTDLFKERTGVTLTHYLNRRRIEYAQERLRETDQISYACHESGFRDVAYFYRVFKRHAGMTPGEYLARVRKEGREVA